MKYRKAGWKEWLKVLFMIGVMIAVSLAIWGCAMLRGYADVKGVDKDTSAYIYWVQTSRYKCYVKATLIANYLKAGYPYSRVYVNYYVTMVPDAYHCDVTLKSPPWSNVPVQKIYMSRDLAEPTGDPFYVQEWRCVGDSIDWKAVKEALDRFWGKG